MKKLLSGVLITIIILNLMFFSFRKITPIYFWTIIIFVAVFAYVIIPRMNVRFLK